MSETFREQFSNRLRAINPDQVSSFVRAIIIMAATTTGVTWLNDNTLITAISAVVAGVVTIYGVWANSDTNLIKSAADVPAVKKIEAPQQIAATIPSDKVVPTSFAALLVALLLPLFLTGCITSSTAPSAVTGAVVTPGATTLDTRIAYYDERVRQYCTALKFASSIGQLFAKTERHLYYVQQAQVVTANYCDRPITDVRGVVNLLLTAYENIMRVPEVRVQVASSNLTVR